MFLLLFSEEEKEGIFLRGKRQMIILFFSGEEKKASFSEGFSDYLSSLITCLVHSSALKPLNAGFSLAS